MEESLGDFPPRAREEDPTIFYLDSLKGKQEGKDDIINMELSKLLGRVDEILLHFSLLLES